MIRLGIAATLLAVAVTFLAGDAMRSFGSGALEIKALGQRWFEMNPDSLNLFQAVVQRYVWPALWDGGVLPVLQSPAWLPFLIVGGALMIWPYRPKAARS